MTYASSSATILVGDCLARLREIPDGSVRTCITSPPYWGLRDYGTAQWSGGDPACDHARTDPGHAARTSITGGTATLAAQAVTYRGRCGKCGAERIDSQIGLESTPDAYVARIVEVFREVRRALAHDGTLWLNLGDSYAGGGKNVGRNDADRDIGGRGGNRLGSGNPGPGRRPGNPDKNHGASNRDGLGRVPGLKTKDLVGIPWLVAFALRADGWYLRSDIIWHKLNPMPESVTDRCTKAHEYVFMMTKRAMYHFDTDAIREPLCADSLDMIRRSRDGARATGRNKLAQNKDRGDGALNLAAGGAGARGSRGAAMNPAGRNRRSVWSLATQPYAGAHFATMPRALVEPCVLAGSAPGDLVLDPFAGAGTTGLVALGLGRRFVGIELNPAYAAMAWERLAAVRAAADEQIERAAAIADEAIVWGYEPEPQWGYTWGY